MLINIEYPQHYTWRQRYGDNYVTTLVSFPDNESYFLRTVKARKELEFLRKTFPGKFIEKDMGLGIYFYGSKFARTCKSDPCNIHPQRHLNPSEGFDEVEMIHLLQVLRNRYGPEKELPRPSNFWL